MTYKSFSYNLTQGTIVMSPPNRDHLDIKSYVCKYTMVPYLDVMPCYQLDREGQWGKKRIAMLEWNQFMLPLNKSLPRTANLSNRPGENGWNLSILHILQQFYLYSVSKARCFPPGSLATEFAGWHLNNSSLCTSLRLISGPRRHYKKRSIH